MRRLSLLIAVALLACGCTLPGGRGLSDLELSGTETAAAPTAPPAPPAPTLLKGGRDCRGDFRGQNLIWVEDVDIHWQDNASHEAGYRVYRNRILEEVLPANASKYHLQFRYNQGPSRVPSDSFAVEAFIDGASSSRIAIDLPRCP
jgi:hypothetical protein